MGTRIEGLTLLELVVALAIAALLVLLATPAYHAWIADMELRDRVEALVGAMSFARAEAFKHNNRVDLCPSSDGLHCSATGRWEDGWIMFADDNDNGDRDDDETILRVEAKSYPGITVRGNKPVRNYVSYMSFGQTRMTTGALQMGTFTVCRRGQKQVDVVLANGGRVRVNRTNIACP